MGLTKWGSQSGAVKVGLTKWGSQSLKGRNYVKNYWIYVQSVSYKYHLVIGGTAVAQWLRLCATNRKVAGSIPDGVIGIFH